MKIGMKDVDFLGLKIRDGKINPQEHIAKKVQEFSDELTRRKHIQPFLGIGNYDAYYIPHLSRITSKITRHLREQVVPRSS